MAITGPFEVIISDEAEVLEFDKMTALEKSALSHGIQFDEAVHSLYRFFVMARERQPKKHWNVRQTKRKSFLAVDRAYLKVDSEVPAIKFLGCFPTTTAADGSTEFDFEVYGEAEILTVGKAGARMSGPIKNSFRKKKPRIVNQRTNRHVDWIFGKSHLDGGEDIRLVVTCVVEGDLPANQRHVNCLAEFKDENRAVEAGQRKIVLPLP